MADFRFFYCKECGTMVFYCLDDCPSCHAKNSFRSIAFYFDEPDHIDFREVVYGEKGPKRLA